jgi:DNA-binding CsgD family transcriptional regulator
MSRGKFTVKELAVFISRKELKHWLQEKSTSAIAKELNISRNTLYKLRVELKLPVVKRTGVGD